MEKLSVISPKLSECELQNKILTTEKVEDEEINEKSVYKLIGSFFQNKLKKEEMIKKHSPCFSLKVIPNQEIEKVYSSLEIIPFEKIGFVSRRI